MNRAIKCILWLTVGPAISIVTAWFIFWFLGFVVGGGIDIDDLNPPWQQSVAQLSLPIGGLSFVVGTFFSLFMALANLKESDGEDA
ncbi:MAG: hypothetical protein AAGJ81_16035 [Verrucomicrobiota bacterium]